MVQIDSNTVPSGRHADVSDAACLALACRGDQDAFRVIVARHASAVHRYASSILASRTDCEDVVQDVFLVLWRKRATVEVIGDSLRPWLLMSTRFVALNLVRKNKNRATAELEPSQHPDSGLEPEWVVINATQAEALKQALLSLPPADLAVARLCLVDGLSYKEAAAELMTTTGAVRNRLHRLRRALQVQLADLKGTPHD